MKATVTRKELSDALAIASSASSQRSSSPALQCVLIEASGAGIELTGCDGEMWAWANLPANVEEPGSICVQQKLLSDIVAALPEGQVSFHLDGTIVVLTSDMSEFKMLAIPGEEFPAPPSVEAKAELSLPVGEFRDAVDSVVFAVSEDASRPYLTGVQFTYNGDVLTLVATDTHRLAVNRIHREGMGSTITATVPQKALRTIKSLPVGPEDTLSIGFDETRLFVDIGTARVTAQLLTGNYPNWERVVPQEHTRVWTIDRGELLTNVKRAMILARDNADRVKFSGQGDKVVISSRSEEKGEAKEEIPVISRNGELEIAFNGRYIMEALQSMPGEGVVAEMTEPSRPAVIRPVDGGEDRFCVVMPMALG